MCKHRNGRRKKKGMCYRITYKFYEWKKCVHGGKERVKEQLKRGLRNS